MHPLENQSPYSFSKPSTPPACPIVAVEHVPVASEHLKNTYCVSESNSRGNKSGKGPVKENLKTAHELERTKTAHASSSTQICVSEKDLSTTDLEKKNKALFCCSVQPIISYAGRREPKVPRGLRCPPISRLPVYTSQCRWARLLTPLAWFVQTRPGDVYPPPPTLSNGSGLLRNFPVRRGIKDKDALAELMVAD